jgi:hypothetical protein
MRECQKRTIIRQKRPIIRTKETYRYTGIPEHCEQVLCNEQLQQRRREHRRGLGAHRRACCEAHLHVLGDADAQVVETGCILGAGAYHSCVRVYMYQYVHIMSTYMIICKYLCTCMSMYVLWCAYMIIYIHTYIHIHETRRHATQEG